MLSNEELLSELAGKSFKEILKEDDINSKIENFASSLSFALSKAVDKMSKKEMKRVPLKTLFIDAIEMLLESMQMLGKNRDYLSENYHIFVNFIEEGKETKVFSITHAGFIDIYKAYKPFVKSNETKNKFPIDFIEVNADTLKLWLVNREK